MPRILHMRLALGASLLVAAVGCATAVHVDVVDRLPIVAARTWTFLHDDPPTAAAEADREAGVADRVWAPLRDARALDREIAAFLEQGLEARGLRRVEQAPDLYVDYHLRLEPRSHSREVGFAAKTLSSLSYTGSYIVEGADLETHVRVDLHLAIELRDPRGRVVWSGEIDRRLDSARDVPVTEAVVRLLEGVPARAEDF